MFESQRFPLIVRVQSKHLSWIGASNGCFADPFFFEWNSLPDRRCGRNACGRQGEVAEAAGIARAPCRNQEGMASLGRLVLLFISHVSTRNSATALAELIASLAILVSILLNPRSRP